jgi:hypothetical protein
MTGLKFTTLVAIYYNNADGQSVYLLFKKPFSGPDEWSLLEQNTLQSCDDVEDWVADYLQIEKKDMSMERVKYIQNGEETDSVRRVLVFQIPEEKISAINHQLRTSTSWLNYEAFKKNTGLSRVKSDVAKILENVDSWKQNLRSLSMSHKLKFLES